MLVGLVAFSSFGQRIGIKAGLNFSSAAIDMDGFDTKMKTGIHFGAVAEFGISDMLAFEPGLIFSQKGVKLDPEGGLGGFGDFLDDAETRLNYLDIPLNVKLKFGKFFAQAGPSVGIALSGTQEFAGDEEDIEFGSDDDQMKRMDLGLNIGAGMQFNHLQVSANYGLGLSNLSNSDDDMKNRVFSVSVGYYFGE